MTCLSLLLLVVLAQARAPHATSRQLSVLGPGHQEHSLLSSTAADAGLLTARSGLLYSRGGRYRCNRGSACLAGALELRGGASASAVAAKESSSSEYSKALLRTALLLCSAVAFGVGTGVVKGRQSAMEFFAGYLVEQSLSVDNLFVFIMLFEYFKVPPEFQSRVLTWGIIGAISMRAVMVVVGVAAIQRFRWVVLLFSGILLASCVKLLTEGEGGDEDLSDNFVLRVSKFFVKSTDHYDGEKFFTMEKGVRRATPLLLCLVCIELSDFVFAVDSIPAVLGISKDTFIVYTSNVFAIMALRSLYTLVSHAITDLPYLKPAVALVLGFVGIKMALEYFHIDIGIGVSLSVVSALLAGGTAMSIMDNKKKAAAQA
jgi:tellurite resistance protein TerC